MLEIGKQNGPAASADALVSHSGTCIKEARMLAMGDYEKIRRARRQGAVARVPPNAVNRILRVSVYVSWLVGFSVL